MQLLDNDDKHLLLRLDTLLAMEERLANEMVLLCGSQKPQNSCKINHDGDEDNDGDDGDDEDNDGDDGDDGLV